MSIDIERQRQICTWVKNWIRTRLNRARCFEPSLRGLRELQGATDCTTGGMVGFAQTRHDTSDGADGWRLGLFRHGAGGSSDTGRGMRSHGLRTGRDDAMRGDSFQGLRRLRHVTDSYAFSKANYPICPAHPPHLPLPLIVVFVAWHRNGAAH